MDIEFEQTLGDGEGQGSLACCSPRGCKEMDMSEQQNNNNNMQRFTKKYDLKGWLPLGVDKLNKWQGVGQKGIFWKTGDLGKEGHL